MKSIFLRILKTIIIAILRLFRKILRVDKICEAYLYQNSDDIPSDVQYCLVLGAKLFANDAITPMLIKRLNAAIELYKKRPNLVFILSGDASKRISNDVQAMYDYLKQHSNIPDEQIILDTEGFTTLDSIRHVTPEMDQKGFILLTSEFHMPRSIYICHRLDLHPYALHLPPSPSKFYSQYQERELVALVKNWYILTFGEPQFGKGIHRLAFYVAVMIGKVTLTFTRILKKAHTTLPGRIALYICPSLLRYLTMNSVLTIVIDSARDTNTSSVATALLSSYHIGQKQEKQSLTIHCSIHNFYMITQQVSSQDVTILVESNLNTLCDESFSPELAYDYILCGLDYLPQATVRLNESFLQKFGCIHKD